MRKFIITENELRDAGLLYFSNGEPCISSKLTKQYIILTEVEQNKSQYNELSAISQSYINHFRKTISILECLDKKEISLDKAYFKIKEINRGIIIPY